MGGLRQLMPVTFGTYAIGMMALSGVPLFFSGAWTKEEILHATAHWPQSYAPYYLMLAGVVLTALYMTRAVLLTFFGEYRGEAHPHESPVAMTYPMMLLAVLSVFAGFLNAPFLHPFRDWIGEPFGPVPALLALAERVDKLEAICVVCGESATRTQRIVNGVPADYDDPIIVIGAQETYEARCRTCHTVPRRATAPA